jgi:broad specificity phosphatase PhoE
MRIILLRHGRSSLPPWPWIKARDLGHWIDAYNAAGIRDISPSNAAIAVARQCKVIVTSDLLRSVESGRALGPGKPMISDGMFREAGLPYSTATFLKMPTYVWAVLFRMVWAFGFKANGESIHAFRKRAQRAAMLLISLAHQHGSALLVGHGLINGYIARELLSAGWRGPGKTNIRHWGHTAYTFDEK